jgi:hypothetical protein
MAVASPLAVVASTLRRRPPKRVAPALRVVVLKAKLVVAASPLAAG